MRLPSTAYADRPWRLHEIASDFSIEDVWALPTPGGPHDLQILVREITDGDDPTQDWSWPARVMWGVRWKLGELLGWDGPGHGVGSRVESLRERLPSDLREAPGPEFTSLPFHSLYQLEDEFAAEIANRTVHGILHLGWVPNDAGGHYAQMTVLVRPNGWFGRAYLAAIKPLRYLVVYPQVLRATERRWRRRTGAST